MPETKTAFLALDYATYIVEHYSSDPEVATRAAEALTVARSAGIPVYHVVPDRMQEQIHPLLVPVGDEPVLGKASMGAFATTSLQYLLQSAGISRVIIGGVATSGTVLSTTRWAYDVGYEVAVCGDACADPDPRAHAALVDKAVHPESIIGLWCIARIIEVADIAGFAV